MKATCAFTLNVAVAEWLNGKKKMCINLSGFVNQILEAEMIREMETQLENTEQLPDSRPDNSSGSTTTPTSV
jgi:hypothetical protein